MPWTAVPGRNEREERSAVGTAGFGYPLPRLTADYVLRFGHAETPPKFFYSKVHPHLAVQFGGYSGNIGCKDLARGGHWEFFSMVPSCHTLLPVYQEVKNLPLPHIHTAVVLCPAPQHMELNDLYLNPQAEINPSFLPSPRCFCREFHCNDKDRNWNFGGQRWKGSKWSLE